MSIFQVETEDIIERIFDSLIKLEINPGDRALSASLYRDMHSLKGAVRMVGYNNIQTIIHKVEDIFDAVNSSSMTLDSEKIQIITKAIESVSLDLQESIRNNREIIVSDFESMISALEAFNETERSGENGVSDMGNLDENVADNGLPESETQQLQAEQENINEAFNYCFELLLLKQQFKFKKRSRV